MKISFTLDPSSSNSLHYVNAETLYKKRVEVLKKVSAQILEVIYMPVHGFYLDLSKFESKLHLSVEEKSLIKDCNTFIISKVIMLPDHLECVGFEVADAGKYPKYVENKKPKIDMDDENYIDDDL